MKRLDLVFQYLDGDILLILKNKNDVSSKVSWAIN